MARCGTGLAFNKNFSRSYFFHTTLVLLLCIETMIEIEKAWEHELDVLHERLAGLFRRAEPIGAATFA